MTKLMTRGKGKGLTLFSCLLLVLVGMTAVQGQEPDRKIVKRVEAKYPDLLKKKGIGGTVRLKAIVKADGNVKSVEVVGGNPILAESAKTAVMQWKFAAGAAESNVDVSVNFDPNY